ncbi:MAG: formylglycine-generating enzyme family protein, partial [Bacteroidales bacterium]|nr:formylglycine-generating enzyme family protein [Bacteroidales bacterium]
MLNKKHVFLIAFVFLSVSFSLANNIQVSDVTVLKELAGDGYNAVSFTVSWDHSWRMSAFSNWDAAWIIGKAYTRELGGLGWQHMSWDTDTSRHSIVNSYGTPLKLRIAERGVGALVYRSLEGTGSIQADMKMWWKQMNGKFKATDTIIVSIFAIEVVYIPQGEFLLGDGRSARTLYNIAKDIKEGTGHITDAEKINSASGYSYNGTSIPSEYPVGYNAFYLMKHEITQHAYVDFLNTLTFAQQKNRTHQNVSPKSVEGTLALISGSPYSSNPKQYRNYIRIRMAANDDPDLPFPQPATYGNSVKGDTNWSREDNAGNVACNFLTWNDILAYADWAGMRPFTELEYEKACRGHKIYKYYADYAWGQGYANYIIKYNGRWFIHEDSANEETAVPSSELESSFLSGPNAIETGKEPWTMRVGAFAKDSTWRGQAGAAFYGAMNMSDNLWERCINVHTAEGRSFVAGNGDGALATNGEAYVVEWIPATKIGTPLVEIILRGFQVSNRQSLGFTDVNMIQPNGRHPAVGGRLALTI